MHKHNDINYIEFPANDLDASKAFFNTVFGWQFQDYGPDYIAFSSVGTDGGFYRSNFSGSAEAGGALVVLYSNDLEASLADVKAAGGEILKPIFSFPGGRRFHFREPSGNELAVWGE